MATLNLQSKKQFSENNMRKILSILTGLMSQGNTLEEQCLRDHDESRIYTAGNICIHDSYIYEAITTSQGVWDESKWKKLSDNFDELSVEDVKAFLNLTPEQLQTLSSIISDTEVRLDKTYSSSKIYTDIQDALKESKEYCLKQLASKSTGSFKKANDTTEVTDGNYLYLILNPSTSKYDIYALVDSNVELLTSVDVNLDDYYTKTEVDNDFLKKTDATSTYATITTVDNDRANVNKMINHIDKYVAIDAPRDSNNMLERFYVGGGYVSYQEFQDSTITKEFKVFSQKYGLTPVVLGEGNDLNDITRNTFFTANKPCANTPYSTGNFIGISAAHVGANGYGFQIACGANENQQTSKTRAVYIRHNYNNVWGEWDRILTSDNQTSNPNLLDNPWFTVNQRGQTTYSNTSTFFFGVDRWKLTPTLSETVNSDGTITITNNSDIGNWFGQIIKLSEMGLRGGEIVTLSIMLSNGVVYSHTAAYPSTEKFNDLVINENGLNSIRIQRLDNDLLHAVFFVMGSSSITIKAVKFEMGGSSTLKYDLAPDYATELIKCQRYYQRITRYSRFRMSVYNANMIDFTVPIVGTMINNPRLLNSSVLRVFNLGLTDSGLVFNYTSALNASGSILIRGTLNSHGLTDGCLYVLDGDLELSADL